MGNFKLGVLMSLVGNNLKEKLMMNRIQLNNILNFKPADLENTKIRFVLKAPDQADPLEIFKNKQEDKLLQHHYYNYKNKSYKVGQLTIGFIRIKDDLWLLFHVGHITKDLNKLECHDGYEYEHLTEYDKYLGRLVVKYKNDTQQLIRNATSVIDKIEISQILPDIFDNDIFPGFENVNLSWKELSRVIDKDTWKTALQNQKGVYLISDQSNGRKYVGSAYGENMILGRWQSYVGNGHGGNVDLKKLDFDHIKENFRFSILDIYKSTVEDQKIIQRESWWKEVLFTRNPIYGYNLN